jgi:hypothetical protein
MVFFSKCAFARSHLNSESWTEKGSSPGPLTPFSGNILKRTVQAITNQKNIPIEAKKMESDNDASSDARPAITKE